MAAVRARIAEACRRSGREPSSVRLVAVTKGHPAEEIRRRILPEGALDLGENRVQEWRDKAAELPGDVRWHFVGSLQRNKVKYLADGKVALVHSLNSKRLATAMNDGGERRGHHFRVLVEVDVAGEETKQGIAADEVDALLDHCDPLPHVEVAGLMAMAPFTDDPEETRPTFATLRNLRDRLGLQELSMGMSRDLEIAIEEGATIVRVGTALFEEDDAAPSDPDRAAPAHATGPHETERRTP